MADRSARALLATLVVATVLVGCPAGAQDPGVVIDGEPCPDAAGVTVVIDFQELGDDTVLVRCADEAPRDGFETLEQAGIPYRTTVAFPGFLCRIAERPDDDPCDTASPAEAYWSYWLAPAGGDWCYSNKGAGNRTPPAGAVEGWSFALDRTTEDVPPPRLAPPGDPDGAVPLATDDCTTAPASSGAGAGSDGEQAPVTGDEDAVGRGDPVDVDQVDDGGSPIGTIAGLAAVGAVVVAAVVLARRRRRPALAAATPVAADEDPGRWPPPVTPANDEWSAVLRSPTPPTPPTTSEEPDADSVWARPQADRDDERGP